MRFTAPRVHRPHGGKNGFPQPPSEKDQWGLMKLQILFDVHFSSDGSVSKAGRGDLSPVRQHRQPRAGCQPTGGPGCPPLRCPASPARHPRRREGFFPPHLCQRRPGRENRQGVISGLLDENVFVFSFIMAHHPGEVKACYGPANKKKWKENKKIVQMSQIFSENPLTAKENMV